MDCCSSVCCTLCLANWILNVNTCPSCRKERPKQSVLKLASSRDFFKEFSCFNDHKKPLKVT